MDVNSRYTTLVGCDEVKGVKILNNLGDHISSRTVQKAINTWNAVNGSALTFRLVSTNSDITISLVSRSSRLFEVSF